MTTQANQLATERAKQVRLMIFDVDGVLTDGGLRYGAQGETIKTFHVLDGHGIKLLQQFNVKTAIISARESEIVVQRAKDLGIDWLRQGAQDKHAAFEELLTELGMRAEQCGYMGDDLVDLPVMTRVGFCASVPNAHPEVRTRAHLVTHAAGGHGAAREVCDFILRAQGNYEAALAPYLR
ncbi:MAG: KdsC family phosphatase [Burkholderiaceae bacterium]|jgi:3-deoxy-D-manno-octulosonate 8-phosphate phosphatase (KDO 8-P phosphatase)